MVEPQLDVQNRMEGEHGKEVEQGNYEEEHDMEIEQVRKPRFLQSI